jgi:hypothetical protein
MPPLRHFLLDVAHALKREFGCSIHLYVKDAGWIEEYEKHEDRALFASISDYSVHESVANAPVADADAEYSQARDREQRLGITYNRVSMASHHFGRGWSLGGFHHHRTRLVEEIGYPQVVHAHNTGFSFWEREFGNKNIDLVVTGASCPIYVPLVAASLGIPYRAATISRFKNLHYWAEDALFRTPAVQDAFARIENADEYVGQLESPYALYSAGRNAYLQREISLRSVLQRLAYTTVHFAYSRLRGYRKYQTYRLLELNRIVVRVRSEYRTLMRMPMAKLAEFESKTFVYFPLQFEPETSIGQHTPEYFGQLEAIASISRGLPAGIPLVVKEHLSAIGRRPSHFYTQIRDMKNTVLMDPWELGLHVVRKSAGVVTMTGTAGFEAAVLGIPVVTFGRHNIYNCVPHVFTVPRPIAVQEALHAILSGGLDRRQMISDGARFLKAIVETSFDMAEFGADISRYNRDSVLGAMRLLIESLRAANGTASASIVAA